jgi:hypothetical protein
MDTMMIAGVVNVLIIAFCWTPVRWLAKFSAHIAPNLIALALLGWFFSLLIVLIDTLQKT